MKKILIIDDDPGLQELLQLLFERAGYEVRLDTSGEHIMNGLADPPDVILLDRFLSGFDGLDICHRIKNNPSCSHIPVIMLSASPDLDTKAMEAGADDFLEKPFDVSCLLATVANAAGRSSIGFN
jgi:DNA-binding response OmpR family regulator